MFHRTGRGSIRKFSAAAAFAAIVLIVGLGRSLLSQTPTPLQTVYSTAALRALDLTAAPFGVERLSVSGVSGDAPPVKFMPDVGHVCATDDGGYCVSAHGNGFWLAQYSGAADVRQWGMSTSANDNSAAFQIALTTALTNNLTLYIPSGIFNFTNSVSSTITDGQSFTLDGAGQDATILKMTGDNLLTFNFTNNSGLILSNLTFFANIPNAGIGLNLIQLNPNVGNEAASAQTTINNVTWRGGLGAGTSNYWTTAFQETGISSINLTNDTVFLGTTGINGDAFNLSGLSNASQSVIINFDNVNVVGGRYGIIYGNYVQGVAISNSNFDEQLSSIIINGANIGDQLSITNSQFGINTGNTIDCIGALEGLLVNGNLFTAIPSGFSGVNINSSACGNSSIVNNIFAAKSSNVGTGISVAADQINSTILLQGNSFLGLNKGINLSANLSGQVMVGANSYKSNGMNVADNNTGTLYSSTQLVQGSSGSTIVVGGGGNVFLSIGPISSSSEGNVIQLTSANEIINITGCRAFAPGTGQTITFTLRQQNISTGLTCTVSNNNNAGIVAGSPVIFTPQQVWDIMVSPSATAAGGTVKWEGTITQVP